MPPDDKEILEEPFQFKCIKFEETGNWHKIKFPKDAIYVRIHNIETTTANRFRISYHEDKSNENYFPLSADTDHKWKRKNGFMPKEIWVKAVTANTWLWIEIWAKKGE